MADETTSAYKDAENAAHQGAAELLERAGGGALSRPLGYIKISGAGVRYVPLQPSWMNPGALVATVLVAVIISRTLVKLSGR